MLRNRRAGKMTALRTAVIVLLLAGFAAVVYTAGLSLDGRARDRRVRIHSLARGLQQYERDYSVLPYSDRGSAPAIQALDVYVVDSVNPHSHVLWVGDMPLATEDLIGRFGGDWIIAAEALPLREDPLFGRRRLYVITASFEIAIIRTGLDGKDVVGTRLSQWRVLARW